MWWMYGIQQTGKPEKRFELTPCRQDRVSMVSGKGGARLIIIFGQTGNHGEHMIGIRADMRRISLVCRPTLICKASSTPTLGCYSVSKVPRLC